jgi:hypothetical protein
MIKRIKRIVDNRVLLLGIDQHYREGMKLFEAKVLLGCAKAVAERLRVVEADVPIEGYYDNREIPELKSYFRLMRALQEVKSEKGASARNMAELKRLREILGSAMYGRAQYTRRGVRMLLPAGRDAFSVALGRLVAADWNVPTLLEAAREAALTYDDISLVGLAARVGDPVALAAQQANRFIELYNRLVAAANAALSADMRVDDRFRWHARRPMRPATAKNAAFYYDLATDNEIVGRCVHVGTRIDTNEKYHWAIRVAAGHAGLEVHEFWSAELWTASRYLGELR